MKLLITYYAEAHSNPLGLPDDYPMECQELTDDEAVAISVPQGRAVVDIDTYLAGAAARLAVYSECVAAYEASHPPPEPTE